MCVGAGGTPGSSASSHSLNTCMQEVSVHSEFTTGLNVSVNICLCIDVASNCIMTSDLCNVEQPVDQR